MEQQNSAEEPRTIDDVHKHLRNLREALAILRDSLDRSKEHEENAASLRKILSHAVDTVDQRIAACSGVAPGQELGEQERATWTRTFESDTASLRYFTQATQEKLQ